MIRTFLILFVCYAASATLPVVIWHGMGDSGYNNGMKEISHLIEENLPGVKTKLVKIGKSYFDDVSAGYFVPVLDQIKQICQEILDDPDFDSGLHLLGLSQGGLFVRGLVQYCPFKGKLGSLVSIGGPQQGVYGFPKCPGATSDIICRLLDKLLSEGAYTSFVQSRLVQAQYWHDPLWEKTYRDRSQFLADLNQETVSYPIFLTSRTCQQKNIDGFSKARLLKLTHLVLVSFKDDSVVVPRESELFGFYSPNNLTAIQSLRHSDLYIQDKLGLKVLDASGRLTLASIDGDHLQFNETWFVQSIVLHYFKI